MTESRGVVGVSQVVRTKDDTRHGLRLVADGALVSQDWLMACAMEGRVYVGNSGTVTTPITFTATATIDTTKPEYDILVPSGTIVIPVEIRVYFEAFGTNAQSEVMASVGTGGAQAGTAITPKNLRVDLPNTTACTVHRTGTGATYMTAGVSEFWRDGQQFAITKTTASATAAVSDPNLFIWRYSDSGIAPVLYSASASSRLNVFQGSQAGTGFITVTWVELPVAAIG